VIALAMQLLDRKPSEESVLTVEEETIEYEASCNSITPSSFPVYGIPQKTRGTTLALPARACVVLRLSTGCCACDIFGETSQFTSIPFPKDAQA
jgi:hypothetical protein